MLRHLAGGERRHRLQLPPEALGQFAIDDQRGCAITGGRQPANQLAVWRLGQRRQRHLPARVPDRSLQRACFFGLARELSEHICKAIQVLGAGRTDPFRVEALQQRATAQLECGLQPALTDERFELLAVDDGPLGGIGKPKRVGGRDQVTVRLVAECPPYRGDRAPQARTRAGFEDVGP